MISPHGQTTLKPMETTTLDYYKLILGKVSFDSSLFQKEYNKAIKNLQPSDAELLNNWLISQRLEDRLKPSSITRI
jgi:hypothetical protein